MNGYLRTFPKKSKYERIPTAAKIIYALTALTAILHITAALSESFADFFNLYISSAARFLLEKATELIPFSFAEFLLLSLPIWIFMLIRHAIKHHCDSGKAFVSYLASLGALLCVFYILFFWVYGVGYSSTSLDKKLSLERDAVSTDELRDTAEILVEKTNEEAENVLFREKNFSVMPYDIDTLSVKLCEAYKSFSSKNKNIVSSLNSRLKPVMLSEAMSYTHITGIYSYFTGEANINVAFPDYTIPYTAAHEMAHQRGIARENEANFVAFLVCLESDDGYIRYSAYLNMLEYVLNALYSADKEAYSEIVKQVSLPVRYEMAAYSKFFDKYRDSAASEISGAINDTYLKLNGNVGEKSYGMVVDLTVAYYKIDENRK